MSRQIHVFANWKGPVAELVGTLTADMVRGAEHFSNFAREPPPNRAVRKAHTAERCCNTDTTTVVIYSYDHRH